MPVPGAVLTNISTDQLERARQLQSFAFSHALAHSPQFDLREIRGIVRELLDQGRFDQMYYSSGGVGASSNYASFEGRTHAFDTVDSLGSSGAWIRLTRVDEIRPQLSDLVNRFYGDLSELHGFDVSKRVMKTFVTLFVSSPGAITPYHMDHTWNHLLQIAGAKTVYVYDPNDREVLTQRDIEAWYMRRDPIPRRKDASTAFALTPGVGVHHPVNAPHWVQNGPDISVSLSLGLCLRDSTRDAKIHQVNFMLRRVGFKPPPPRPGAWRDSAKVSFLSMFSDRKPATFDAVLFSGRDRLRRYVVGAKRLATLRFASRGEAGTQPLAAKVSRVDQ